VSGATGRARARRPGRRSDMRTSTALPLPAAASGGGHGHFRQIRRGLPAPSLHRVPYPGRPLMKTIAITLGAALLAGSLLPAAASNASALPDCVSLSPTHQGTRAADNAQLLLKDGDAHYRVGFNGACDAIARSSRITLETNGEANLLCPQGTTVRAANARCSARSVELIEADVYERRARMNRRR